MAILLANKKIVAVSKAENTLQGLYREI